MSSTVLETEQEIVIYSGYEPHEKQKPFHESKAKYRGVFTGIGFGKSAMGANALIEMAMEYPCEEDSYYAILAPTSKVLTHSTMPQFWKFFPKQAMLGHLKKEQTIYLINGSKIVYLTADNKRHIERLSGLNLAGWWADEARLFHSNLTPMLKGRMRSPSGARKGIVTTSPAGQYHPLYKEFVLRVDPKTGEPLGNPDDYEVFTGSTLDNPYTPDDYKQDLLDSYKGKFAQQEIYGKWVGFEGQVYDNFNPGIHIISDEVTSERDGALVMVGEAKIKEVTWSIDWGFTNPTVVLLIAYDTDDRAYVIEEFYRERQKSSDVLKWMRIMKEKYGRCMMRGWGDHSPDNLDDMAQGGFFTRPANKSVREGIESVYEEFCVEEDGLPRLFIHRRCKKTIEEISTYRYAERREGRDPSEEPVKENDHAMDALRYGIHSKKPPKKDKEHRRETKLHFLGGGM